MTRIRSELGPAAGAVEAQLARWRDEDVAPRMWRRDPTLWSTEPCAELADRLGWLELPERMAGEAGPLTELAESVRAEGCERILLLGMGGSSLAPEVFQRTFGNRAGFPRLEVVDTTHPDAVHAVAEAGRSERTLHVVSSKSGGTLETMSLFRFFWERCAAQGEARGHRFVAITDPGSSLEALAGERGFRRVFPGPPDVGGRYSALSYFGLVPAALIGLDPRRLLGSAGEMARACAASEANPGLELGAALGELAVIGRDKLTFVVPPTLESLPDWLEQLIAESTGKDGKGLVPVVGEPLAGPEAYGDDRVFIVIEVAGNPVAAPAETVDVLAAAGHPVLRFELPDLDALGGETLRWEVAVAAASMVLGVHPFNQPDVQLAKDMAKRAMADPGAAGPEAAPGEQEAGSLAAFLAGVNGGDSVAIQAFLAPSAETGRALRSLQQAIRAHCGAPATTGWGPRFLHSTGQLHKGGPDAVLAVQLVDRPRHTVAVPETRSTFNQIIAAQARGDAEALGARGRRVLTLDLGDEPVRALADLCGSLSSPV